MDEAAEHTSSIWYVKGPVLKSRGKALQSRLTVSSRRQASQAFASCARTISNSHIAADQRLRYTWPDIHSRAFKNWLHTWGNHNDLAIVIITDEKHDLMGRGNLSTH
eukprot:gnl/TRDRNA2_/TRDRNA2_175554_c1_seq2.p1 gnl/TRDRNA2_/TRDRNA2_175554_c1~~gnl/TRDRNA2_/TRDRNA2_175554_c1_seq2.p1  ORF type:complete len:120 (-),score=2.40 gnl/TRDRNA2_/TRDRNA2_175554_c1_seq2:80-400(-)